MCKVKARFELLLLQKREKNRKHLNSTVWFYGFHNKKIYSKNIEQNMTQILHAVQATLELFHVIISQAAKTYDVNLLRNTYNFGNRCIVIYDPILNLRWTIHCADISENRKDRMAVRQETKSKSTYHFYVRLSLLGN